MVYLGNLSPWSAADRDDVERYVMENRDDPVTCAVFGLYSNDAFARPIDFWKCLADEQRKIATGYKAAFTDHMQRCTTAVYVGNLEGDE